SEEAARCGDPAHGVARHATIVPHQLGRSRRIAAGELCGSLLALVRPAVVPIRACSNCGDDDDDRARPCKASEATPRAPHLCAAGGQGPPLSGSNVRADTTPRACT